MTSLTEQLKDPNEANRFASYVLKENPNIENFEDFEDALKRAFSKDQRGSGALNFINDEESKLIFESSSIQNTLKSNVGEEKYDEVYEQSESFEVQRKVPKGVNTKRSDILVVPIERKFTSHTGTGQEYKKGYRRFSNAELKFIEIKKARNIETKKIIYEFNQHFKANPRSESSIKTKVYRT